MEVNGELQAPAPLTLGEETGYTPRVGMGATEKEQISPAENRSPAVQPASRRCNNWAIPAPN
jgi:hypothetical protein